MSRLATFLLVSLAAATPAASIELPIPAGDWGYVQAGKPSCQQPIIRTTKTEIVQLLPEGKGVCTVTALKGATGRWKCKWDASVPQGLRENPDGDDNAFSLKKTSPNGILFNNMKLALCGAPK